jgi:hypothetical protein
VLLAAALTTWALLTRQTDKARLVAHLGLLLIVFFGLTGLWTLRNWISTGYAGFSAVFSEDMYCCVAASILASNEHRPYTEMENRLGCYDLGIYFDKHPERRTWPIADIIRSMRGDAEHILLSNPLTFARLYLTGVNRATFDPVWIEFLRLFDLYPKEGGLLDVAVDGGMVKAVQVMMLNPLLTWGSVALLGLQFVYVLGACRAVFRLRVENATVLTILIIMVYYVVVPGGPHVWARFRHPAMPLMCMLAAYELARFKRRASTPYLIRLEAPPHQKRALGRASHLQGAEADV